MKKYKEENIKSGFLSGVFILSLSTFIVKFIGLALKIPMMSLLGAQGMGYFNSAYEIYALLCVVSTAGLPTALSMLVSSSEQRNDGKLKKIYKTAMLTFAVIGSVGTAIMLLFSDELALAIESPDSAYAIASIAPALLCVCVASALRGYFQGLCRMAPTAFSQLIEALSKLVFGIFFARLAISNGYGLAKAAAAAIMGISLGTLLSAIYLFILKFFHDKREESLYLPNLDNKNESIFSSLIRIALPITAGSAVLSFTRIIDMVLIMRRLQDIEYTSAEANGVYGSYTTLAVPIFSLIPSLIAPIALALVPRLSAAIERGSESAQANVASTSLRITVLFAMPASFGIAMYSEDILKILFKNEIDAISIAAPLLAILGISVLFSCLITTSNAILQSYRQVSKPIISMGIGTLVKAISAYLLIGAENIGVYGAPISTLFCDITVTVINLYYIRKYTPNRESVFQAYFKPFAASLVMAAVSLAAYLFVGYLTYSSITAFVIAVLSAVVTYAVFIFLFGAVEKEDILMLPFGERICRLFEKTN